MTMHERAMRFKGELATHMQWLTEQSKIDVKKLYEEIKHTVDSAHAPLHSKFPTLWYATDVFDSMDKEDTCY